MRYTVSISLMMIGLFLIMPVYGDSSSAEIIPEDLKNTSVKNVYSCEFTSLGTLPAYEENTYYFLIRGSGNYKAFQDYFGGEFGNMIPSDDFNIIEENDRVVAYYITSETYSDGYKAVMEFYNQTRTFYKGYLMLNFEPYISVDTVYNFFTKGSVASISWVSQPTTIAYFGDTNLSKIAKKDADGIYHVDVNIEKNGSYNLRFINTMNDNVHANVWYEINGYERSGSTSISITCMILGGLVLALSFLAILRPKWSKDV